MKILVVSNMYPSKKNPSFGTFVKNFCVQLDEMNLTFEKSVMLKASSKIGKIWRYIIFYIGTILRLLIKKYDVVYVHYASHSAPPVLFANKLKKLNIITNVHGSDVVPKNKQHERMHKYTEKILKQSHKIVVPSDFFGYYVANKYKIDSSQIFVYPSGGINCAIFRPLYDLNMDKWKGKDIPTYGMATRFTQGKGWDIFLSAISEYLGSGKMAKFIIVGNGNQKKEFDEMVETLGLTDKIIWSDLLDQQKLAEFYNDIDMLVFPIRSEESLGLIALEAMACGTPVISSDFAAPKYYVKNGINGYKFKVNDSEELVKRMYEFEHLSQDHVQEMRKNALNTGREYSTKEALKRLKKIFEE